MKKKLLSAVLSIALILSLTSGAFAVEAGGGEVLSNAEYDVISECNCYNASVRGGDVNLWSYRKVNVTTTYEWSGYYRVSDNIYTSSAGGSISCNQSRSFGASISGDVSFINVSASGSVSSSIGYALHVGPYQQVYMGYRVMYKVERGTREKYCSAIGCEGSPPVESNNYIAKSPQYGEYALINY